MSARHDPGRRRLHPILPLSLSVLLAGCAQSGPLDRPEPESARPDLTFVARSAHTEAAAEWTWSLRNDDDAPVLVFVGIDPQQMSAADPAPVWVMRAKGSTVEVSQRLIAPPANVAFAAPYGVAAQVLAPGDVLEGTTRAQLPLTTSLPWPEDIDPSRAVPDSPSQVYLCLGVGTWDTFGALPTVGDQGYDTPDPDQPYAMHTEWYVAEQHLFCTDPEPLD